jgi:hypothetical protein
MTKDLMIVAQELNRARNAMIRYFLDFHAAHPDVNVCLPKHAKKNSEKELSATTMLYHFGRLAAPKVNSNLVSAAAGQVWSKLRSKISYTYRVKSRFMWEGILAYEIAPPQYTQRRSETNTGLAIPAPRSQTSFAYCGQVAGEAERTRLIGESKSSALLRFVLWSKDSGRKHRSYVVRVHVDQLSDGNRAFLRKIARGEVRIADSQIVYKRGAWFFQLAYEPELGKALGEKKAALVACPHVALRPFQIEGLEVANERIRLPSVEPFLEKMRRLTARRRAIQYRQRHNAPGHGRDRIYSVTRPIDRQRSDHSITWIRDTCSYIARRAWRAGIATIEYFEPVPMIREFLWFGKRGIPFNWTTFLQRLTNACKKVGIEIKHQKVKGDWYRERYGEDVFKGAARTSEIEQEPGVADMKITWRADEEKRSAEPLEKMHVKQRKH